MHIANIFVRLSQIEREKKNLGIIQTYHINNNYSKMITNNPLSVLSLLKINISFNFFYKNLNVNKLNFKNYN